MSTTLEKLQQRIAQLRDTTFGDFERHAVVLPKEWTIGESHLRLRPDNHLELERYDSSSHVTIDLLGIDLASQQIIRLGHYSSYTDEQESSLTEEELQRRSNLNPDWFLTPQSADPGLSLLRLLCVAEQHASDSSGSKS